MRVAKFTNKEVSGHYLSWLYNTKRHFISCTSLTRQSINVLRGDLLGNCLKLLGHILQIYFTEKPPQMRYSLRASLQHASVKTGTSQDFLQGTKSYMCLMRE